MYSARLESNESQQSPTSPPVDGKKFLIRDDTKTTEYLMDNPMSPKLNLKAVGVEYLP